MRRKKTTIIVVYTTFPDLRTAQRIVRGLVRKKLCACGNIFRISSVYAWKGRIEEAPEYAALIKTRREKYLLVEQYIQKRHPYEVPAVVSWPIVRGLPAYQAWLHNSTK